MPAFTFEKISPPGRRAPGATAAASSAAPRRRSLIVRIIGRFVDVRVKRTPLQDKSATTRDESEIQQHVIP